MQLKINKPQTVYIRFTGVPPHIFKLYGEDGNLYYFRYLDGKTPRIKFNLIHKGEYFSETPFVVIKETSIELPKSLPKLPPPDRGRYKGEPITLMNRELPGVTPVIYSREGVIEYPPGFLTLPPPVQRFLMLHEKGHLFYSREEDCDLFALVNYLREGYNRSMAFYSLNLILSDSEQNRNRIQKLYNEIQTTQKNIL